MAIKTNELTGFSAAEEYNPKKRDASRSSEQYLSFFMAGEEYGVDILSVQEIRGWEQATPIPNAPKHVKGVINLRGAIVPILDLRQCFGLTAIEYTPVTVVVVLKVNAGKSSRIIGVVVDAVSDVYLINDTDVKSAPDLGNASNTEFIHGFVSINDKMIILLDIEQLLSMDDFSKINELTKQIKEVDFQ